MGFRVWGVRVLGSGFRVQGLGFWGLGFGGLGFRVQGLGFWGLGFRVPEAGRHFRTCLSWVPPTFSCKGLSRLPTEGGRPRF